MRKSHRRGESRCNGRHCDDVDNYRDTRAGQLADWRNETAEAITFKEWLGQKRYDGSNPAPRYGR